MHRGEDDIEEEREYGVSFVTILHELQKTYNWRRNFGLKQKMRKPTEIIDVDAVEKEMMKKKESSINQHSQKMKSKMNAKDDDKRRKHAEEKKPIMNEKIREKREFKNMKKEDKKKKKVLDF